MLVLRLAEPAIPALGHRALLLAEEAPKPEW